MKKYNINTYRLYKEDVKQTIKSLPDVDYEQLTRNQLITKFMPLVENIAKKFSTAAQASGTLDVLDIIQEGSVGLVKAVDRIDWNVFNLSEDKEKTMKSFLSKRIRGAIRRSIDMYRGHMRIPEHKLNDIRKNFGKNEKMVAMFFNSLFISTDDYNYGLQGTQSNSTSNGKINFDIEDTSDTYNVDLLNIYLSSLLRRHLNSKEYQVLRMSYGLDCRKHSAQEIADTLGLKGSSAFVRVSQLKRQAVDKLINNVDPEQVLDYM
jgi:RNA polymerase sigma factor (sigma-70 family)